MPDLAQRLADVERKVRGIPSRFVTAAPPIVETITDCMGDDVLLTIASTDWLGVALPGTVPTVLPQVDPTSVTVFPDFLGKGKLNGGVWVWIAVKADPGSGVLSDTLLAVPNGQAFLTRKAALLPVTGGGSAKVYFPWEF